MPKHRGTFKLGRAWRCEAARNLAGLPRSQRVVLKELAYRGNERGYCYPSYKQLAKWTGYSSKTNNSFGGDGLSGLMAVMRFMA